MYYLKYLTDLYYIHIICLFLFIKMEFIELRSDTMTELTKEMRQSIVTSPYGDWTYGED
jgi:hypothetical protein